MDNRDYFTKPIQGGSREGHDYGNTRLDRDHDCFYPMVWAYMALITLIVIGFIVVTAS